MEKPNGGTGRAKRKTMKTLWMLSFFWVSVLFSYGQSAYNIEIPDGFEIKKSIGKNVILTASDKKGATIVIVKVNIPPGYSSYSIWDIFGDLDNYMDAFVAQGREHFQDPKVVKYGKTSISNLDALWYDYTVDNGNVYNKTYQIKKDNLLYTVTFTCHTLSKDFYEAIWFRAKNSIKL